MADTLTNVPIPKETWVDLYAATSIAVGTKLIVQNIAEPIVFLTVLATEPNTPPDAYNIVQRRNGLNYGNTTGDSGAWAYCELNEAMLSVGVAP